MKMLFFFDQKKIKSVANYNTLLSKPRHDMSTQDHTSSSYRLLDHEYLRMSDLATTAERKPRKYTSKNGDTRIIKGKPASRGLLPFGESTLWTKVRTGEFPAPVRLSDRITAWKKSDIVAWMKSKEFNQ